MCGICGIFSLSSDEVNKSELLRMNSQLVHRGPDEEGIYVNQEIGLASRRLSIIDLKTGKQPIHNESKNLWVVFNGEIYNFLKIKKELLAKGHRFYTESDTECLVHLYEDMGAKCVDKLEGMFAFAIWDERKKELCIFRDPVGKKPLYWTIFNNKFYFASEPKSILSVTGFRPEIDRTSLTKYFFYGYVPSPKTIFQRIRRISSGNYLKVDKNGKVQEIEYWDFDYSQKTDLNKKEIKNEILKLLKEAVDKRLISDVPIGIFLSGGIDSSLIAALVPTKRFEAFTIGFEQKDFDESLFAKQVAKHFGFKQNLRIFSEGEVCKTLPKILEIMDEPMADPSILPTYLLCNFSRQKVKVALSGDGGDENFAGYPKYLGHFFLNQSRLEKINLSFLSPFLNNKLSSFFRYSNKESYLRNQLWISSLDPVEVEKLVAAEFDFSELKNLHRRFNGSDLLDEAFYLDQKMTLSDQFLVKVDRISMANGLEVRCPFLDKNLVEFCAKIPSRMKIEGFKTKSLLREIAKDFLPKEIIDRPKMGFGIPLERWLENNLKDYVNEYISPQRIKREKILNYPMVEELIKRRDSSFIWKLLLFEVWKEKWLKN